LPGERGRRYTERDAVPSKCVRCSSPATAPDDQAAYAYLLGLYLGDGHLVTSAKVPVLRVYCTSTWPGLIVACERAMLNVLANKVQRVSRTGCVAVQSYSNHWPCLFPQHGPGKKHDRLIQLTHWQQELVNDHAGHFVRGLIHSDGCRATNRIVKSGKTYAYPRYMFSNESVDIMGLCQESLDRLGIGWRMCRRNLLSVARRADVAALDRQVGAKY
jgi:hypothetical protein